MRSVTRHYNLARRPCKSCAEKVQQAGLFQRLQATQRNEAEPPQTVDSDRHFEGIPVFQLLQEMVKKLFTIAQFLVKKLAFPRPE
jgi:hypothetical protein